MESGQFLRKASLLLVEGEKALDLSQFRFTFNTVQNDEESPNNCAIRVFNLSETTVQNIRQEYSRVVVQAGYENGAYGIVFQGTIKQYRIGKEPGGLETYLDILAADGDLGYNFAIANVTIGAGSNQQQRLEAAIASMNALGLKKGYTPQIVGGILPRGKVLFGLSRAIIRSQVQTMGATWSISDGRINVIPLTGYLPGEAVVLNSRSGLIGRVEQTQDGMRARCLMNPKITIGSTVRIDNASINKTVASPGAALPGGFSQLSYNKIAGFQQFASIAADGLYRVYVAEHTGDTRGNDWYTDLVCLSINPVTSKVKAF